jgi:hypothetical protein
VIDSALLDVRAGDDESFTVTVKLYVPLSPCCSVEPDPVGLDPGRTRIERVESRSSA